MRYGKFFDRRPGALDGIKFCLDVTSDEYRALWPQGYEPWCAELEVFHNPFARHPLPEALLPEATHWVEEGGEMVCRSHYETNILWSGTLIQTGRHHTDLRHDPGLSGRGRSASPRGAGRARLGR